MVNMLADERSGYLAGVDILYDGGTIRGQKEFKKEHAACWKSSDRRQSVSSDNFRSGPSFATNIKNFIGKSSKNREKSG